MQTTAVQSRKKTRPQEAAGSFRCVNLRSGITPHALLRAISFARLDLGNAPRLLVVGPRPMGLMPCMGSWGLCFVCCGMFHEFLNPRSHVRKSS